MGLQAQMGYEELGCSKEEAKSLSSILDTVVFDNGKPNDHEYWSQYERRDTNDH